MAKPISLDWPLSCFLNREARGNAPSKNEQPPTLTLPEADEPGSGNIVICGRPGTGKSTLALQIAVSAARKNDLQTLYLCLEESPESVFVRAKKYGWSPALDSPPPHAPATVNILRLRSIERNAHTTNAFEEAVGGLSSTASARVWLTSLAPRPLTGGQALFEERYTQLESLVDDIQTFNEHKPDHGPFGMVVIDSLGMFGTPSQTREASFRIFELFSRSGLIGAFTAGEDDDVLYDSTQADMVIKLTAELDQGYMVHYLEVAKSRYQDHVRGRHPYKLWHVGPKQPTDGARGSSGCSQGMMIPENCTDTETVGGRVNPPSAPKKACSALLQAATGLIVYPSLHWYPESIERDGYCGQAESVRDAWMSWRFLTPEFSKRLRKTASVTLLEGPLYTFKTHLAHNFLYQGMLDGHSGLLVTFSDRQPNEEYENEILRSTSLDYGTTSNNSNANSSNRRFTRDAKLTGSLCEHLHDKKANAVVYSFENPAECLSSDDVQKPRLVAVSIYSGNVLPEEVIYQIRLCIEFMTSRNHRIKCAVLDDISAIGIDYPLLRHSKTTGTEFIAFVVRIFRKYGVELAITGTTGEQVDADSVVQRARLASDAVIQCRYLDIFGGRYLTIDPGRTGALEANLGHERIEGVPAVLRITNDPGLHSTASGNKEPTHFAIDCDYLDGLTGFGTSRIQRPGVLLHLFAESNFPASDGTGQRDEGERSIHSRYARLVHELVHAIIARSPGDPEQAKEVEGLATNVSVHCFDANDSHVVHASVNALSGPLDRTVLYTLDDFFEYDNVQGLAELSFITESTTAGASPAAGLHVKHLDDPSKNPSTSQRKTTSSVPFYKNLLFLVHRSDVQLDKSCTWADLAKTFQGEKVAYDQTAEETLACILLDACISARSGKVEDPFHDGDGEVERMFLAVWEASRCLNPVHTQGSDSQQRLPPDAKAYVCWYSQLRQLLKDDKNSLAADLHATALPGGGFQGDWRLTVARESVSIGLGVRIINAMCSVEENERRFLMGVGLPATKAIYRCGGQPAWPRGQQTLRDIFAIYESANTRRNIYGYPQLRSFLAATMNRFIKDSNESKEALRSAFVEAWTHIQQQRSSLRPSRPRAGGL